MSRDELLRRTSLKRETLDDAISGRRRTRAETRRLIAKGFGINPEELFAEELAANAQPEIRPALNPNVEALLRDVLAQVTGMPLAIARSIVAEFGEDGVDKSAGELEALLRRKAVEYRSLRDELVRFSAADPEVRLLRDAALSAIDRGDFDQANDQLRAARRIDQKSAREAEDLVRARRGSEAETILSTARLAALLANYQEAFQLCLEARRVVSGSSSDTEARAITMAANYLNAECQEIGTEGLIEQNIKTAEETVLRLATSHGSSTYHAVCFEIADLYALLGYRNKDKKVLRIAAVRFREICETLTSEAPSILRMRSFKSLGDTHVEIGLNRKSKQQIRVGLKIMEAILHDPQVDVPPVERANCLIRLGTAQANAGLISPIEGEFAKSVASYDQAMALIAGLREPLAEARAWWGLSIALLGQGKEMRSVALLTRAEMCCETALKTLTRDKYPVDWATNIQNRGNAKLERGQLENDTTALFSAIDDYFLALEVRTKDRFTLGFVKTKGNMAIAKRVIAERTRDRGFAMSAKLDMEDALLAAEGDGRDYWSSYYSDEMKKIEVLIQDL